MRRALPWIGGLVALPVLGAVALFLGTAGDHGVPATVIDDPALPRLEVGGVTLHGQGFGPEDAPSIVVLHGGPGADHRSLLPLAALSDGYHVTFYDQRGAGLSERVAPEELTLDAHLEELTGVLDLVSAGDPVILIGHSWGAMLASAYLGRHPERVARAVLIEPGFLSAAAFEAWSARSKDILRQPGMIWRGLRAGFEAAHVDGPDPQAAEDYLIGTMMGAFATDPGTGYACPGAVHDSPSWRARASASREVAARASAADLDSLGNGAHRFAGPVLILAGSCSTWIGEARQREHLGLFADARLSVIPAAGHDVVDDAPEATLDAIRHFLGQSR
ncbi:alpha/beta fold hydrolase [Rhodobacterales bacterium HKCCSP123]|nr:alpha/beta fold hydrolase [Rhodobacterales bacterium HKCCSP123]